MPRFAALRALGRRFPDLISLLCLLGILWMAWGVRSIHRADWDGYAPLIHPDEYYLKDAITPNLRVPDSFWSYLNTECEIVLNDQGVAQLKNARNPEEPDVSKQRPSATSGCNSLNPRTVDRGYVYGSLPVATVRYLTEKFYPEIEPDQLTSRTIAVVGRSVSSIADLISIVILFLLGRTLNSRRIGLLAGFCFAWSPALIQHAHFFVVDGQAAMYGLLTLYASTRLAQSRRVLSAVLNTIFAGAALALAVSCKITLAPLGGIIAIAAMVAYWHNPAYLRGDHSPFALFQRLLWSGIYALPFAVLAFLVMWFTLRFSMPDAFNGFWFEERFVDAIANASATSSGEVDAPSSHQWAGRSNYTYELTNMIRWGMGVPLGIAAWLGWLAFGIGLARSSSRQRLLGLLPIWLWTGIYFFWQGGLMIKPMRYLLPIYGPLILFAAWGLISLVDWARREGTPLLFRKVPLHGLAVGLTSMVAIVTLLWGWGFSRIYDRPHTRTQASAWAHANIPPGSTHTSDSWDIGIPGMENWIWTDLQLPIVNENDAGSIEQILQVANQANYLAFTSNRAYDSLDQLPMRFPATLNFFKGIFDGTLGYEKVADFTSYPSFLGIRIADDHATEDWSVYDHPRVTIWKRTERWNIDAARQQILADVNVDEIYKLRPKVATPMPTMLQQTVAEWREQLTSGSWAWVFEGVANSAPLIFWVLALELLGLAAFGLLWRLKLPLPDRGLGMARLVGLFALALIAWLPAAWHWWSFNRFWIAGVYLVLVALGSLSLLRSRHELRLWWQTRRAAILTSQAIYVAGFAILLTIRYLNPDLWHPGMGGEKPMNLAYLTATLKSVQFPPYDPWFAGGYMNYYYWGYVLMGTPMKLLAIRPEIGFNLALISLFAITAQLSGSFGYNLLSTLGRAAKKIERRACFTAVGAAVALMLLGNLVQPVFYFNSARVLGNSELSWSNPEQSSQGIWLEGGSPVADAAAGFAKRLDGESFNLRPEWPYWNATRVIPPSTISEFPFFSFLYGDLHAHIIGLSLLVLLLLGLVGLYKAPTISGRALAGWSVALGILVGALKATNVWDYPLSLALSAVALLVVGWQQSRTVAWPKRWLWIVLPPIALFVVMTLVWSPFNRYLATGDYGKPQLLTNDQRMSIREFTVLYGLWFWILIPWMLLLSRRVWSYRQILVRLIVAATWLVGATVWFISRRGFRRVMADGIELGNPPTLFNNLIMEPINQHAASIFILLPLAIFSIALLWSALAGRTRRREVVPLALTSAGILLLLLTETIVLPGAGRMNVVFKFGYEAWALLALAAASVVPLTLSGFRSVVRSTLAAPLRISWATVTSLLVLGALVYPITATQAKVADRYVADAPRGLDGMAWMEGATWVENREIAIKDDAAAIRWMRANIEGTPTVLEASTSAYRWNSRIATWTGLPTLIGWDGHQNQQRAPAEAAGIIANRKNIIQQIYTAFDANTAQNYLDRYGVSVIYLGGLERAVYGDLLPVFEQLKASGRWRVGYDSGTTQIYLRTDAKVAAPTALPPVELPGIPPDNPVAAISMAEKPLPQATVDNKVETPRVDGFADWAWINQNQAAAVILWLLFFEVVGLLAFPIVAQALRSSLAAAWSASKIAGILLLGWLIWLPTSLGFWQWTRLSVIVGLAMLAALALAAWYFGAAQRIRTTWRQQRRAIIISEVLFISLFAVWTLVRAANPDLWHPYWGGEKPFEFGFLNAVLRSPNMPPLDPFYSQGTINYYYYGLYLMALPMKLFGLNSAIGFNLAVATVGALIGLGAWVVGLVVTRRLKVAAMALVAVALLGNLAGVLPIGTSTGIGGVVRAWQACELGGEGREIACAPLDGDSNLAMMISDALSNGTSENFTRRLAGGVPWFWGPSRVTVSDGLNTINEFPLWSVIFADLHPHLIALPITLLVVALAWEVSRRRRLRRQLPAFGLAALAVGSLAAANAWDVPTYGLVLIVGLMARGWQAPQRRWWATLGYSLLGVATVALGLLLYAPFLGSYKAPVGGVWPIRVGTALVPWLAIYGLFLLVITTWLLLPLKRAEPTPFWNWVKATRGRWLIGYGLAAAAVIVYFLTRSDAAKSAITEPSALPDLATIYKPIFSAGIPVRLVIGLVLAGLIRRFINRVASPSARWAIVLGLVGGLVALGVELIFIRDHLAPGSWEGGPGDSERMNTVFKFGYQVWVLWALSAALLLPHIASALRTSRVAKYSWQTAVSAGVVLALFFPIFGTLSRVGMRFDKPLQGLTLDGLAYMQTAEYSVNNGVVNLADDLTAIRWITENITGTEILLQSEQEFYRAFGVRITANTGLPTVISALHAGEQRPGPLVDQRIRDVMEIYSSLDVLRTQWLLNKYGVDYVYVGQIERLRDPMGVDKFVTMAGVQQVYQNNSVTIYKTTPQLRELAMQWRDGVVPAPVVPNTPIDQAGNQVEAAVALYESDPNNAGYAFEAGKQLWQAGQADRAAAILGRAADVHPNDIGLHHLLGDVLLSLKRYDQVVLAYEQAYNAGPTPQNQTKLGQGYFAWAELDRTKLDAAAAQFSAAIIADSQFADPHYHLAEVYRLQGNNAEARREYETYLSIAPPEGLWVGSAQERLKNLP
ncbi:MAG: DUF2298 domain-containing protein [Chloroflexi bacterium]|nr:DUF2298 domain-containing protein [Chloroflexota bacterium]